VVINLPLAPDDGDGKDDDYHYYPTDNNFTKTLLNCYNSATG